MQEDKGRYMPIYCPSDTACRVESRTGSMNLFPVIFVPPFSCQLAHCVPTFFRTFHKD